MIWVSLILFLLSGYLSYYHFFYQSKHVDSNIFKVSRTLALHTSDIWTVKFSPDGKWIASGSVDSTVKICLVETGNIVLTLKQPGGITYLDFSPDGNYLSTASYDEKVRLWKLPEGILLKEFKGHKGTVWAVCFSPDGKTIASSGEDATVKLWDIESGQLKFALPGHILTVWDVKFSPDGQSLASGSFDKTIKIWNASDGKLIKTLDKHSEAVVAVAFSHDGKQLVSTSDDKTIQLWNTDNWNLIQTLKVPEHIQAADFSRDDKLLLTGGKDKPGIGEFLQNFLGDSKYNKGVSMRLWDVKTGRLLQTFSKHSNDVNDVAYSPDGKWIVSGSSDKTVQLWRLVE